MILKPQQKFRKNIAAYAATYKALANVTIRILLVRLFALALLYIQNGLKRQQHPYTGNMLPGGLVFKKKRAFWLCSRVLDILQLLGKKRLYSILASYDHELLRDLEA